jgi:hypothetical protein
MRGTSDAGTSPTLKTAWDYFSTACGIFVGQAIVTLALMATVRLAVMIFGRFL